MNRRARPDPSAGPQPVAPRPPDLPMEPLLGVRDVARMLGVPVSWVYATVAAGRLPHLKLGKYLKFEQHEVAAWLEQQRRPGNGAGR